MQRALEQHVLECWQMQQEAQIEDMMRRGVPLGAVAAAVAFPETAERIAVLEAATATSHESPSTHGIVQSNWDQVGGWD